MKSMLALLIVLAGTLLGAAAAAADGPADNVPDQVRPIPPKGIALKDEDRSRLERGLRELRERIARMEAGLATRENSEEMRRLREGLRTALPDVAIFAKALSYALEHDELFAPADIARAESVLNEGLYRTTYWGETHESTWPSRERGLMVHGYVSRIDGSVQPYGLVVPDSYRENGEGRHRLDIWFHGRGETLSEVNFIDQRLKQRGEFTPAEAFVLHPYGRYCNANKFAGEVDVLEALEDVCRRYRIDPDRISVRGFSMGGAACWQFAVHYPDRWFAANPGAGFSETARFLKVFQRESLQPTWYEKKLWGLYDCDIVAANLRGCPTVAYSGELDAQKQAADVMAEALEKEGIALTHIIGPQTKHRYHPDAKSEVERRMASLADRGRDRQPRDVTLTTYTLKYNRAHWLTIEALGEHWVKARVDGSITGPSRIEVRTENVTALGLDFAAGWSPFSLTAPVVVAVDGQALTAGKPGSDRSWRVRLAKEGGSWGVATSERGAGVVKRHDLQGPIDDAFMGPFVFVLPTGSSPRAAVSEWVGSESRRAIEHWRSQFRGDARVKKDTEITDEDIAGLNLVLWGDPESNAVIKRIADRLPIQWDGDAVRVGTRRFEAATHVPLLIAPNPLNPERYVVLNSGFTFRDYDYLNNARQVPKLPDWAIVDVRTRPNSRFPGRVAAADFFGEGWELRPEHAER